MNDKKNELSPQNLKDGPQSDNSLVGIDLPLLTEQIKEEKSWQDGKRNAITVFKSNDLRILLIALHEGSEMARHVADGIISVQVLEGLMRFDTDQQSVALSTGQMLVLHKEIFHSVKAIRKTIFLLTVTNSFATKRNHL